MIRSEDDWMDGKPPVMGSAEAVTSDIHDAAGVLWIPDPEQRRGWREVYIDKPGGKAARSVGFSKPGAR